MMYKQKDLGYERATTSAAYEIEMPDGSRWHVPVQLIADSRDEHYADEYEDTVLFIREKRLDRGGISDWAANNMNWDDVKDHAIQLPNRKVDVDYQDCWANGRKKIVGEI